MSRTFLEPAQPLSSGFAARSHKVTGDRRGHHAALLRLALTYTDQTVIKPSAFSHHEAPKDEHGMQRLESRSRHSRRWWWNSDTPVRPDEAERPQNDVAHCQFPYLLCCAWLCASGPMAQLTTPVPAKIPIVRPVALPILRTTAVPFTPAPHNQHAAGI